MLTWEDAERLFARLLETEADIDRATLYGVAGQAQHGIDVYGRLIPTVEATSGRAASYVCLQSRRIKKVTAAAITKAVDEFLAAEWAERGARFYYATSASLRHTTLDTAVRAAADACAARGIEFVPWGVEELSDRLRDHPRLVDDFFGRAWAEVFCSPEQVAQLSRRVTVEQARHLRTVLGNLYRAAFRAHGASSTVTATDALPYLVLDTVPVAAEQDAAVGSTVEVQEVTDPGPFDDGFAGDVFARRRSTRPRRAAAERFVSEPFASRTPADEWMAASRLRLLIGAPGSGKTSFLMFAAADLLSISPQSSALQRAHAGALPLWLPFAFLCRHLEASTSNSVVSAVRAWITQQGGEQTWSIIEPALDDDRVVLFVDGVDEWSDLTKADQALGLVESFVTQKNIAATLSARPYALTRLGWTQAWVTATLAPLSSAQKLLLADRALADAEMIGAGTDAALPSPAAETFLAELDQVPALAPLTATPLFLCVLATSWRGETLSPQRFRLFSDLVRLLVDRHPQMRRRASSAAGSEFPSAQMLTVLRGVAYRARQATGSAVTTRTQMEQWFRAELSSPEGLGYPPAEAHRIAFAALSQAEDEYGVLVPQGVGLVGFLHRVLLDQLAGEHLATLAPADLSACLRDRAGDATWRDVLIAGLSAQVSAHVNVTLLDDLCTATSVDETDRWELIAAAIAAGVAISPGPQSAWVDEIVARAAEHHDHAHRAALTRSLAAMTRHPALRARLLPVFSRWLAAGHLEPGPAIWALRNIPVSDDDALRTLLWALRHEDAAVQLNAAHAIATRFTGSASVETAIVERVRNGATAIDQAYALLCLGTGWPDAAELPDLLAWARAQPTPELRICGLHFAAAGPEPSTVTDNEQAWLRGFLRQEPLRPDGWWMSLAKPFIDQAVQDEPGTAEYILETLSGNGRNGGNRFLAWHLACTTFREDVAIRAWVAGELGNPAERGLILYDLSLIPDSWRADPDFARQAAVTVRRDAANPPHAADVVALSAGLPDTDALDALIPALDDFRPVAAASALLERFGDDPRAVDPLRNLLTGEYRQAARLAPVALSALGIAAGFDRLVDLLRAGEDSADGEAQVVVAVAVADAWVTLSRDPDPAAAEVLRRYDADEIARRCTAVSTGMLTWHVGPVIAAWPHHPAVIAFAREALRHPRSLTRGIGDPAPGAILRTYGNDRDPVSQAMVSAVLDQLAYLPADTREVLTVALTESDLAPGVLAELLADWTYDPDIWVQRAALTGMVRRFTRYRLSADADPAQLETTGAWLRDQIRSQLVTYGPDFEDRRQNAWVAMLLVGEPELHDGIRETLGEPTRPGVRLTRMLGGADVELIDLVNATWASLVAHFGEDDLFVLLSDARAETGDGSPVAAARGRVLTALTQAPAPQQRIRDLIVTEADTDDGFRRGPAFLAWSHRNGRNDATLFSACLTTLDTLPGEDRSGEVYELLVDATAWDIPDHMVRDRLHAHPRFAYDATIRALFAERFPDDALTQTWFQDLEDWFRIEGPRRPRQWQDTLAIAVRASPAEALPTIVERAHEQVSRHGKVTLRGHLTGPLLRRLRSDADAAARTRAAMTNPLAPPVATPIWQPPPTRPIPEAADAARRSYLHARMLQRAGLLDAHAAMEIRAALLARGSDAVTDDPFLDREATLRNLSGLLIRPWR